MIKKISYSFRNSRLISLWSLKSTRKSKKMSDHHICGVLSDKVCSEWQGSNICSLKERIKVINSCKHVDEVMTQNSMNPEKILKNLKKV